jgi:hypothetical protein
MVALLCVAGIASAQTGPVLVEISPGAVGDTLTARYTLPSPATVFRLDASNAPQRDGSWLPLGADWVFDGIAIRRTDGAPFSRFELQIHPDRRFIDRKFVSIDRVGNSGWTIFIESFRAADLATRIRVAPRRGYVVLDGSAVRKGAGAFSADLDGKNRVIYFGPAGYIKAGPVIVIAGPEAPSWLVDHLRTDSTAALMKLTARFGAVDYKPKLVVTNAANPSGGAYKGSTLADGMIHLSLRGLRLDVADENLSRLLTNMVIHEMVHLWNGHRWASGAAAQQPWLHEGSAEYLAARLWRAPEDLRDTATARLNACLDRRDRRPMDGSAGPVAGQAPYDCGFVIQLFAEAAARTAGGGDIFDLWKAVFAKAVQREYSPQQFLAAASAQGPGFADLADTMLGNAESIDHVRLLTGMRRIGIEAVEQPTTSAWRAAGIMSVLDSVCSGSRGFTTAADRLILDTGDRCGAVLAGDPEIVSVNGVDLLRAPARAHEAIRAACAAGDALIFTKPDGTQLEPFRCKATVRQPRPAIELKGLPEFR